MKNIQDLVIENMSLADRLAYQKKKNLPKFIDIEELKSAAYLGLVEAANRFKPEVGVKFSTFAYVRIFGAMCDYLRENYKINKDFFVFASSETNDIAFENFVESKKDVKYYESLELFSLGLDSQTKKIIQYYFIYDYSMKEVGKKLGLSESRICQLIKQYKLFMINKWKKADLIEHLAA